MTDQATPDTTLTIKQIFRIIWFRKLSVAALTLIGIGVSIVLLAYSTPLYRATMVITAPPKNIASLSAENTAFSALGGITGVSSLLSGAQLGRDIEFLAICRSILIAERLDQKYDIKKKLFGRFWDKSSQSWDMNQGSILYLARREFRSLVGLPSHLEPTVWDIQSWIGQNVKVTMDKGTLYWNIAITSPNPNLALDMLEKILFETESHFQEREKKTLLKQSNFIQKRLRTVESNEQRNSLIEIMVNYERRLMLVESGMPMGAKIVQPPRVSDRPVSPRASLFVLAGVALSLLLSIFAILIYDTTRAQK